MDIIENPTIAKPEKITSMTRANEQTKKGSSHSAYGKDVVLHVDFIITTDTGGGVFHQQQFDIAQRTDSGGRNDDKVPGRRL